MLKAGAAQSAYSAGMDQATLDRTYFTRRASEEQAAAERAQDPRARQTHIDLAERYSQAACSCETAANDQGAGPESLSAIPLLQPEFRILP